MSLPPHISSWAASHPTAAGNRIQVLCFHADWSRRCRERLADLEPIARAFGDVADFFRVAVERQYPLVVQHAVREAPTVILLQRGVEVGRLTGARDADAPLADRLREALRALRGRVEGDAMLAPREVVAP